MSKLSAILHNSHIQTDESLDPNNYLHSIRKGLVEVLQTLKEEYDCLQNQHEEEKAKLNQLIQNKDEEIAMLKSKLLQQKAYNNNTPLKILLKSHKNSSTARMSDNFPIRAPDHIQDTFESINLEKGLTHRLSLQIGCNSGKKIRLSSSKIKNKIVKQEGIKNCASPREFLHNPRAEGHHKQCMSDTKVLLKQSSQSAVVSPRFFQAHPETERDLNKQNNNNKQLERQSKTRICRKPGIKSKKYLLGRSRENSFKTEGGSKNESFRREIVVPIKIISVSDIKLR